MLIALWEVIWISSHGHPSGLSIRTWCHSPHILLRYLETYRLCCFSNSRLAPVSHEAAIVGQGLSYPDSSFLPTVLPKLVRTDELSQRVSLVVIDIEARLPKVIVGRRHPLFFGKRYRTGTRLATLPRVLRLIGSLWRLGRNVPRCFSCVPRTCVVRSVGRTSYSCLSASSHGRP